MLSLAQSWGGKDDPWGCLAGQAKLRGELQANETRLKLAGVPGDT